MATEAVKKKTAKVTLNANLKPEVGRRFKALCMLEGKKVPDALEVLITEYVQKSGKVSI